MTCPKCGHENSSGRSDCERCGVIFAKLQRAMPAVAEPDAGAAGSGEEAGTSLQRLLLGEPGETAELTVWLRAAVLIVLGVWGLRLTLAGIASNAAGESLLHLVNLPFHEAGHVIFRPFGQFFTSLGGTLGQLLVPLICLGVLLVQTRDPFGAALCGWWFGENFLDIAPYLGDARAGELPLVGGNFGHSSPYGFHDWEYLLTETGLLRYDQFLARLAHGGGALLMLAALGWGGWIVWRQYRSQRLGRG
jgi:hypothetical protein